VETGHGRFEVDVESGSALDAFDATDYLPIEIPEAGDIYVIARAGDDKIEIRLPHATFAISEFQLNTIAGSTPPGSTRGAHEWALSRAHGLESTTATLGRDSPSRSGYVVPGETVYQQRQLLKNPASSAGAEDRDGVLDPPP
jgi:hypothetical protein